MGSGASSLTAEQKATIAKEMKAKYESIDSSQQATSQEDMMKYYEELVAKVQAPQPVKLPAGKKKRKLTRNRSFDNGNFLLENVAQPKKQETEPEQDFWDSVTTQPVCLVCKMVFSSDAKRDTHVKYSEVHAQNVAAIEKKNAPESPVKEEKQVPAEAPSMRCRELYSGSKFYWRLQDTLEFIMYLHLEENCIEVIPYDHHAAKEYDRMYFDEGKIYKLAGPDKIAAKVKAVMAENAKNENIPENEKPNEKDVASNERRQAEVSLLMSKLQLTIADEETKTKELKFNMIVEGGENPLLAKAPKSVTPVLVKRRRLSTSQEIEAALNAAIDIEANINEEVNKASELENLAHIS